MTAKVAIYPTYLHQLATCCEVMCAVSTAIGGQHFLRQGCGPMRLTVKGNPLPPPMERTRAVEPACEIGQSLLYCSKHPMKIDDATPEHTRPLFTKALKRSWVKKCAQRYPELAWSKIIMEKVAERAKARQEAAERQRLQVHRYMLHAVLHFDDQLWQAQIALTRVAQEAEATSAPNSCKSYFWQPQVVLTSLAL